MPVLSQIYLFCAGAGFLYVVATAGLGMLNAQQGGADAGGDASSIDSGGEVSPVDAGGDSGDFSVDGGDAGDLSGIDAKHGHGGVGSKNLAHVKASVTVSRKPNLGLLMLKLSSPSTIAMFSFFFGLGGLFFSRYVPGLGDFSFIPATVCGVVGYNVMCGLTNSLADKMHASSLFREDQLIGTVGEISVPITDGRVGEVIYVSGQVRGTASAKAKESGQALTKSSKVIITDVQDGVFIVEPCTDFRRDM